MGRAIHESALLPYCTRHTHLTSPFRLYISFQSIHYYPSCKKGFKHKCDIKYESVKFNKYFNRTNRGEANKEILNTLVTQWNDQINKKSIYNWMQTHFMYFPHLLKSQNLVTNKSKNSPALISYDDGFLTTQKWT